jgi:hypothetical protein
MTNDNCPMGGHLCGVRRFTAALDSQGGSAFPQGSHSAGWKFLSRYESTAKHTKHAKTQTPNHFRSISKESVNPHGLPSSVITGSRNIFAFFAYFAVTSSALSRLSSSAVKQVCGWGAHSAGRHANQCNKQTAPKALVALSAGSRKVRQVVECAGAPALWPAVANQQ